MDLPPLPRNSKIRLDRSPKAINLTWKNFDRARERLILLGFFGVWLSIWLLGELDVALELWQRFQGKETLGNFGPLVNQSHLLIFWLGGWTLSGIAAIVYFSMLFLGPGSSQLCLTKRRLKFKPGRIFLAEFLRKNGAAEFLRNGSNADSYFNLLPHQGLSIVAPSHHIGNLQLIPLEGDLKLCFDVGIRRVELGQDLQEIDKRWLYQFLKYWLETRPQPRTSKSRESHLPPLPRGSTIAINPPTGDGFEIIWQEPEDPLLTRSIIFVFSCLALGLLAYFEIILGGLLIQLFQTITTGTSSANIWLQILLLLSKLLVLVICTIMLMILTSLFLTTISLLISIGRLLIGTGESKLSLDYKKSRYKVGRVSLLRSEMLTSQSKTNARKTKSQNQITVNNPFILLEQSLQTLATAKSLFGQPVVTVPKAKIQQVQLKYWQDKYQLLLITASNPVEIATSLSEPEKEWLYQILYQWLAQ
jgi:hypothetical protein